MEVYGQILLIAMPAFFILIMIEKFWGIYKRNDTAPIDDMISSLSSGITNSTKDVLGLSIAIISYGWLVNQFGIFSIGSGWLTFVIAFISLDFAGYWVHRISHEYNIFWNNHIIHHSSEEFNLSCALRQSISSVVRIFGIFLLPAAILGVPQEVISVVAPLHLFSQFWYHTRHIDRMGFLEKIIVTPSHHRVHHAINPIYLDKNYGQVFIIWDRLFGTYQDELEEVPAVYGVTRPVQTWNPIKINFMHLWLLIQDAWRAQSFMDKLRIWFMPLGWRPEDVASRFPIAKIDDVYKIKKYSPKISKILRIWSAIQLLSLLLIISYLYGNIAQIGAPNMFIYGIFIYLTVYAMTELMDQNQYAWFWELIKFSIGFYVILSTGDWFGLSSRIPGMLPAFIIYLIVSMLAAAYFSVKEPKLKMAS